MLYGNLSTICKKFKLGNKIEFGKRSCVGVMSDQWSVAQSHLKFRRGDVILLKKMPASSVGLPHRTTESNTLQGYVTSVMDSKRGYQE